MTDVVALASVISSGAVAVGGLWVTYRSGRDQRKHEAQLAYEERAWDKKSASLYSAIAKARELVDTIRSPNDAWRNTIALWVHRVRDDLGELLPGIEAYASAECRDAFHDLRGLLLEANVDPILEMRVIQAREAKEEAIDAQDFKAAAEARDRERKALGAAVAGLGIDLNELARRADRLIDAARASVRGDA